MSCLLKEWQVLCKDTILSRVSGSRDPVLQLKASTLIQIATTGWCNRTPQTITDNEKKLNYSLEISLLINQSSGLLIQPEPIRSPYLVVLLSTFSDDQLSPRFVSLLRLSHDLGRREILTFEVFDFLLVSLYKFETVRFFCVIDTELIMISLIILLKFFHLLLNFFFRLWVFKQDSSRWGTLKAWLHNISCFKFARRLGLIL